MEVKEPSAKYLARRGYKQTEVGLIPEDWDVFAIGQCLKIRHGKNQLDVACLNGQYPILGTGGEIGRASRPLYSKPSVLIGRKGTIDVPRFLESPFWTVDTLFYSEVADCASPKYMFYQFCLVDWYSYNEASGVPSLNAKTIEKILIPSPPTKAEQEVIAGALSDADSLIESLQQLITKKRHIKQGTMQQLLTGKKRLPGFSGEWEVKRLGDVCHMKSGEGITSDDIDEHSEFPCYGGNGLRGFSTRYMHDGSYALIGRQGALCGNVVSVDGKFFASEHAIVVTPQKAINIHWLSRVLARMNLNQYSESSAQPGLSVSKLLAFDCIVPPYTEQTAIATILSDMDTEIAALETKLAKARQIKQGMMQELLTGKIRLVESGKLRVENGA